MADRDFGIIARVVRRPNLVSVSAERRLVILLARLSLDTSEEQEVRELLGRALDWSGITERLARGALGPLLYHHLRTPAFAPLVPRLVLQRLQAHYARTWMDNERMYAELARVLGVMENAGLEVVVLKGAALAATLYRNTALRPMGDVDLLVRPGALREAARRLEDLGYAVARQHEQEAALEPDKQHLPPYVHASGMIIELHHNVQTRPFAVDLRTWWPAVTTVELRGRRTQVLGVEHTALHLLLHHTFHLHDPLAFGTRVRQLCDIRETIVAAGGAFRWDLLLAELSVCGDPAASGVLGELLALDRAYGALALPPQAAWRGGRTRLVAWLAELDLALDAGEALHTVRREVLLGRDARWLARESLRRLAHHRAYTGQAALGLRSFERMGRRGVERARGMVRIGGALLSAARRRLSV